MTWRILWIPVGCVLEAADWVRPAIPPAIVTRSTARPMRSHAQRRAFLLALITTSRCLLSQPRSDADVTVRNSWTRTRPDTWLVHAPAAWSRRDLSLRKP